MNKPLWNPTAERIGNSNLTKYFRFLLQQGRSFKNFSDLYNWSIEDIENFWLSIKDFSGIIFDEEQQSVIDSFQMPGAHWFSGARLNFAKNLLRFSGTDAALISHREHDPLVTISYAELNSLVKRLAVGLLKLGIKKGDRVAAYINNIPEAVIAMLAAASIGAVWSAASPDFGCNAVIDRFGQIKPKVLFAVSSYSYNGKIIDCTSNISKIIESIQELETIILIPHFQDFISPGKYLFTIPHEKIKYFENILEPEIEFPGFESLPFDHPLYILYSSGTTGKPKCIVHGAGGTLLQHAKELLLHTDLHSNDTILYFTTCGWMMWNWLISSLFTGAAIVLYDGSPVFPKPDNLFRLIDELNISHFGTSPKFLSLCEANGIVPKSKFSLGSLKVILSTGAPLSADQFRYVYSSIKEDVHLASISGGTDIVSCFMLGCPIEPVYAGEIQTPGLGMAVEVYNEAGESVVQQKGELVCTKPFPSMPVYFWNDSENKKYRSSYFEKFPGVWCHGDFIEITEHGGIIVYGRSDAVLNPGGVRIGTAEIYRTLERCESIADSIVIGQNWKNDIRIVLFVLLKDGYVLDDELKKEIQKIIKEQNSPRHVPSKIFQVFAIPHTRNGKKVELAAARLINGETIDNRDALENPESLNHLLTIKGLFED